MTTANVKNTTQSPLRLPNGPLIDAGRTVKVTDWQLKESNTVVQAWLDTGALELSDVSDADEGEGSGGGDNGSDEGETVGSYSETKLRSMTNAELASYIEGELDGDVKSGSTKDELVAQALELQEAASA